MRRLENHKWRSKTPNIHKRYGNKRNRDEKILYNINIKEVK